MTSDAQTITSRPTPFHCITQLDAHSCQPFNCLQYGFALCDLVTFTFDLLPLISGRGLMMDYPCGKFGNCSFSSFVFIVPIDTHTHTVTHD